MRGFWTDFRKFIARGNVLDLAVAVVIGNAFSAITNSLVQDVLMPPLGFLLGGADFSNLGLVLATPGRYASVAQAIEAGAPVIRYGVFLNTIINFLIVAFAMFLVLRSANAIKDWRQAEEDDPASPAEPPRDIALLTEIRDLLKEQVSR